MFDTTILRTLTGFSGPAQLWIAGAALAALLALYFIAWRLRGVAGWVRARDAETVLVGAVTAFTLVATVEGAWRLADDKLHATGVWLLAPALFFEGISAVVAIRAHKRARQGKGVGWFGPLLIGLGFAAGFAVKMGATNPAESRWRFIVPVIGTAFLVFEIATRHEKTRRNLGGSWKWTPRRLGISLGWIIPDVDDIDVLNRDRAVKRMTSIRRRIEVGGILPKKFYRSRLQVWSLRVDDSVIFEVRDRVTRSTNAEILTSPVPLTPGRVKSTDMDASEAGTPAGDLTSPHSGTSPHLTSLHPATSPHLTRQIRVTQLPSAKSEVSEVRPGLSDEEILSDLHLIGGLSKNQMKSRYAIGQTRAGSLHSRYLSEVTPLGVNSDGSLHINGHKILNRAES